MRVRRHLSYANVVATIALLLSLAGGAYAVQRIGTKDVVNNSLRSADLKNGKGVKGVDVKPNSLTGKQINERGLNTKGFVPGAGDESAGCDPSSAALKDCLRVVLPLRQRTRILAIATGGEESIGGPATAHCEIRVDNKSAPLATDPGEETSDNTSGAATNGFARTLVTRDPLSKGRHKVALACNQLAGNVRIDAPTIAAIAIGGR
jgi:hypothetical protein